MRGPSLRARLLALLLFLSIVPTGAAVWLVRTRVRDLFASSEAARIDEAFAEFDAAIEREARDLDEALDRLAATVRRDAAARAMAGARPGTSLLRDWAARLMEQHGLDCLTYLDGEGVILAAGHAPGRAGTADPGRLDLPEGEVGFVEESFEPGLGAALTLQARRTVSARGATAHLVGGRLVDSALLARLAPGGSVRAALLDRRGATLAASRPDAAPAPPAAALAGGATAGEFTLHGVPHAFRLRRLAGARGEPVGALLAAVSLERRERAVRAVERIALVVIAGGAALSVAIGLGLARGVTRPLRRLQEMARRIAADQLDPIPAVAGPGEVGDLVRSFNMMAGGLRDSRERLRQTERLAAAEEVARRVAHEIKNPLSPIALTLEALVRTKARRPGEFDAAFVEAVATIQEEIGRMRRVLEDFARFGRLRPPAPRPVDLNALVRRLLPLYEANAAGAGVVADLDPGLAPLPLDPDRLSEVLANLIGNALQALAGPGTVRVSTRAVEGGGALLVVRDTGPGLDAEARRRLFEPYFSTRPGGTGLGLAIARRIVLDHGGAIEAVDPDGGGTEIRVHLPAGPPAERAAAGSEGGAWRRS